MTLQRQSKISKATVPVKTPQAGGKKKKQKKTAEVKKTKDTKSISCFAPKGLRVKKKRTKTLDSSKPAGNLDERERGGCVFENRHVKKNLLYRDIFLWKYICNIKKKKWINISVNVFFFFFIIVVQMLVGSIWKISIYKYINIYK